MARKELRRHEKNFFAYGFVHDYNEACVSHHSRFSVLMCLKRIMLLLQNLILDEDIDYFRFINTSVVKHPSKI